MHMRKLLILVTFSVSVLSFNSALYAQNKLIILVRHAEKAALESAGNPDPELSEAGKQRAERLVKVIGRYRPGAVYSTNYRRTRDTVTPIANKRKKPVQIYDPSRPQDLLAEIMSSKTKRFVIAGHSNTVPGLANLITKKDIFKNLQESEYTVIWLIRIKNGAVTEVRLLDY